MSAPRGRRDLYAVLGVPHTATEAQIKQAFRKEAMRCHPDKNPGDEAAAERFKQVSTAYAVLCDPQRKRQYDLTGDEPGDDAAAPSAVNVHALGTLSRLFGALATQAGIPVPTEIAPQVLGTAAALCGRRAAPLANDPSLRLSWGAPVAGMIGRQQAHFFRLTVSEADLASGVVLRCASPNADKFKVVFFNPDGEVCMVERSRKGAAGTAATLLFVPFEHYGVGDTHPAFAASASDEAKFMVLDTFERDTRSLPCGDHVLCVYGDNWFQDTHYQLTAAVAVAVDDPAALRIMECEMQLADKREALDAAQPGFMRTKQLYEEAKRNYDAACQALARDVRDVDQLCAARDAAYDGFVNASGAKYPRTVPVRHPQSSGGAAPSRSSEQEAAPGATPGAASCAQQ